MAVLGKALLSSTDAHSVIRSSNCLIRPELSVRMLGSSVTGLGGWCRREMQPLAVELEIAQLIRASPFHGIPM